MNKQIYLVLGSKPWNRVIFDRKISHYPGEWRYLSDPDALTLSYLEDLKPSYLFFLHWSWMVPQDIVSNYSCVCFHMTDVPYGRGGSPLQNLIQRGHRTTQLTALHMVSEVDAGPVYLKRRLSLEGGTAEEIFVRASELAADMILDIITLHPEPQAQQGAVIAFKRRHPRDSKIPELHSIEQMYDFIRMLDGEGYPKAYFDFQGFRFEFNRASRYHDRIQSDVTIRKITEIS